MSDLLNVVVLDDDEDLSTLLTTILKHYSIRAIRCSNVEEAGELLRTQKPQLLLSDMLLTGSDGRDFCRWLRSNEEFKGLKIMMMSAYPDAELACRAAGADDFAAKPFEMDELIDKIQKLLA